MTATASVGFVPHPRGSSTSGPREPALARTAPTRSLSPAAGFAPQARGARLVHPPSPDLPEALAPLRLYLRDPRVTDVLINSDQGLFVDRGAGPVRDREWEATEAEVRRLAVSVIVAGGRHIDEAHPCVDVRLAGIRAHAVLPPVSVRGTLLSIRVAPRVIPRLDELAASGVFGGDERMLRWLHRIVVARTNLLITGGTGTGKTTLLSALLSEVPARERIVTVEDVSELRPSHPHHVSLEARQANLEGAGEIPLDRLVREALRMRPDRVVVGECRGAEVRELLAALNTGHDGGAGTLHASGLLDVPARLEALGAIAGLDDRALARQAVSAIGAVLHLARGDDGGRRLVAVGRLGLGDDGRLTIVRERPWASETSRDGGGA